MWPTTAAGWGGEFSLRFIPADDYEKDFGLSVTMLCHGLTEGYFLCHLPEKCPVVLANCFYREGLTTFPDQPRNLASIGLTFYGTGI